MADASMTDLILDRIRFRSTEIGAESESVPRSVRSLQYYMYRPLRTTAPPTGCNSRHIFLSTNKKILRKIPLQHPFAIYTKLNSYKLTHQICSLIFFPPNSTVLILKSIPAIHRHRALLISHTKSSNM